MIKLELFAIAVLVANKKVSRTINEKLRLLTIG